MNKLTKIAFALGAFGLFFTSCDKNNKNNSSTNTSYPYALLTYESQIAQTGYLTAFSNIPQGGVTNITGNSLQVATAFGMTQFGNWIFTRSNNGGQAGIQKYVVGQDGKIQDGGFLPNGQMFDVVSSDKGYYWDPTRGTMLLQIFNPTTMQRTGQIDLSSLALASAPYNSVGQHIIAARDGQLFVGVVHGSNLGGVANGYGNDTIVNYVELAVINIATDQLEKTIKYQGLGSLGWGSSANKMWTLGDDSALYFYATGMSMIPPMTVDNSAIIRIKAGQTDFDSTWILRASDLNKPHATFGTSVVKNGKIYVQLPSQPIANGFTNLNNPIWNYYAVDLNTKTATEITGMPQTQYAYGNDQCIFQMDGKIYLWMGNSSTHENGYYLLNESNNTASPVFHLTDGGTVAGFVKLGN